MLKWESMSVSVADTSPQLSNNYTIPASVYSVISNNEDGFEHAYEVL